MKKLIGFLVLALVVVVAAIGAALFFGVESAKLAETASFGPSPTLPEPSKVPDPDRQHRARERLAGGRQADRGQRACGQRLRHRARSSALALCPAQRRRAGRGDQRAAAAGGCKGHQGLRLQAGAEAGRRRRAERQPHHAACATRRRRRRGDQHVFLEGPQLAVRHGAGRQRSLRRQHRRHLALSLYRGRDPTSTAPGEKVADLPAGPINHHWTKNVIASRDGARLYATVGSNSNVGENGLDKEENRAAILEVDPATGKWRVFASGLRNPNGMAWQPETGVLWTVVNERDELGSDLVPDYLTSVKDGGFYGWPYSYYGQHVDTRVPAAIPRWSPRRSSPDYALGNHTASLGLAFDSGSAAAGAVSGRRLHRPARLVEPQAAQRLQGDLRAVRRRPSRRAAGRRADRFPRTRTARRWAARSASPSTSRARCWSPTTSATRSGG